MVIKDELGSKLQILIRRVFILKLDLVNPIVDYSVTTDMD